MPLGFLSRTCRLGVVLTLTAGGLATTGTASAAAPASKPAIFDDGRWYLRNSTSSGPATSTFTYGRFGDAPVMGDWDGTGNQTVGVARLPDADAGPLTWFLSNSNSAGSATVAPFTFGAVSATDDFPPLPLAGDWDGDGIETVGVAEFGPTSIVFSLRNSNTSGPADVVVAYGRSDTDLPVVGDWDGDGHDTVGVVRNPNMWLLRNSNSPGSANLSFAFGSSRADILELPVVGDWDGDGTDNPAVLRDDPPTKVDGGFPDWFLRAANSSGPATTTFRYGSDALAPDGPLFYVPRLSYR